MERRKFLTLVREKAKSSDFRSLLDLLAKRRGQYLEMESRIRRQFKENRAKREGITIAQIERESSKGSAEFALRPDEIKQFDDNDRQRIADAKNDEDLLHWVILMQEHERRHERSCLNWKKGPPENKPLHQQLVDFLDEDYRLMAEFAKANDWSIPDED